jgi:hypothetical protein
MGAYFLDDLACCFSESWSLGQLDDASSCSRVGIDLKHWCHPCTMLKGGSVCITRQCRVVFTHNCESVCLLAPCLNWFEVRHGHTPCNEGYISINDWPKIRVRVGDACKSVALTVQSWIRRDFNCWCVIWKRWQSRLVDEPLFATAYMWHNKTRLVKSLTQQMVNLLWKAPLIRWGALCTLDLQSVHFRVCDRRDNVHRVVTWLILPVVICLSQRLSHACLSITLYTGRLRMAH